MVQPVTKVTMRRKIRPESEADPNVIRLKIFERPFRWYHGLAYHYQAFIKTAILSWFIIVPAYYFNWYIASLKSRAETLAKMDPNINSDNLRQVIVDYKKRKASGLVEQFEGSEAQKALGGEGLCDNRGTFSKEALAKVQAEEEERAGFSFNRNKRTGL